MPRYKRTEEVSCFRNQVTFFEDILTCWPMQILGPTLKGRNIEGLGVRYLSIRSSRKRSGSNSRATNQSTMLIQRDCCVELLIPSGPHRSIRLCVRKGKKIILQDTVRTSLHMRANANLITLYLLECNTALHPCSEESLLLRWF